MPSPAELGDDDVDQSFEAEKVFGIARVEPGRMRMRRRRYQKIQRTCAGLTTCLDDGCRELAVTGRNLFIDGEGVKGLLEQQQTAQALGTRLLLLGDKHTEVQLGQRHGTDGQIAVEGSDVGGDDNACVEDGPHVRAQGSRRS